jgi:hypothetical protein
MYTFLTQWAANHSTGAVSSTATASNTAGTSRTGTSSLTSDIHRHEVVPPEYERYCAAVSVWGPNISSIMDMVTLVLPVLYAPDMLGTASHLFSWQTGEFSHINCCMGAQLYVLVLFKPSADERCLVPCGYCGLMAGGWVVQLVLYVLIKAFLCWWLV